MRNIILVILGFAFAAYALDAADAIGFKQIELPAEDGSRGLNVTLWYPAQATNKQELVGENGAFVGLEVYRNVSPVTGPHPLVLLSHGYGGSWRNLNWLAGELAESGYVVAAPDHPGTTTLDKRVTEAIRLWERPRDISRTLTAVLDDAGLAGQIDGHRVAVIGHSLGGWTAVELAGGRYDADLALKGCDGPNVPSQCKDRKLLAEIGIVGGGKAAPELGANHRDGRVRAIVTLDLGPASGFLPDSLAGVDIPVLVYAAGTPLTEIAARKSDSTYVAKHLPKSTTIYREIHDATHFSFVQLCKPGAAALIEEESPGESFVCRDGGTRDRVAIHREVADTIIAFLARVLPSK